MKLTFLGTSAANACPIPFCACGNCQAMRAHGGPSLRKRSALLVNDDLLIDLGPDIEAASLQHGIPLTGVRYCLQTHSHPDHCDPGHLLSRSPEYGVAGAPRLDFYASRGTLKQIAAQFQGFFDSGDLLEAATAARLNLAVHEITAWQPVAFGPYRVTAIPANHAPEVEALLFAIEAGGAGLLYATDTAALPEETWKGLDQLGLKFSIVILDHTYGPGLPGADHLCATEVAAHVARLRREGLLAPEGRAFATHISHEGNPPHPELSAYAAGQGYEVAYDGLLVET